MEDVPFFGSTHYTDAVMFHRRMHRDAWHRAVQSSINMMNGNSALLGSDESIRRLDALNQAPASTDIAPPVELNTIQRTTQIAPSIFDTIVSALPTRIVNEELWGFREEFERHLANGDIFSAVLTFFAALYYLTVNTVVYVLRAANRRRGA